MTVLEGPACKGERLAWPEGEAGGSSQRLRPGIQLRLPPLSPIKSLVLSLASIRTKSRSRLKAQLGPALLHVTNLPGFISPMSLQACNSRICPPLQSSDLLVPKGFFDEWLHNPMPTPLEPLRLSLYEASQASKASALHFSILGLSTHSGGCLTTLNLFTLFVSVPVRNNFAGAGLSAIPICPMLLEGCSVKLSMYPGRLKVPKPTTRAPFLPVLRQCSP